VRIGSPLEESTMRLQKNLFRLAMIVTLLALGACGPSDEALTPTVDVTLIYTQVAQTVAAQFTQTSAAQTAAAPTATATSMPTQIIINTVTPGFTPPIFTLPAGTSQPFFTATLSLLPVQDTPTGVLCNDSDYETMIGVQNGAVLKPGQQFATGWLIQNTGFCNWGVGYTLVRTGGNTDFHAAPFAIRYPKDTILAGAIAEISMQMTAPKTPGLYEAFYQMYSNLSVPFGTGMSIRIEVRK
jgi:hypothetical protein